MKRVVVTGGAGFIGSHMTEFLLDQGLEVLVLDDLSSGTLDNLEMDNKKLSFKQIALHEATVDVLTNMINGYDCVFHMAAFARIQPSIEDPLKYHTINVDGTLKLLIACRDAKIKKIVYSASSAAYGDKVSLPTSETHEFNPVSPYGIQKLIGEQYCRVFSEVYNMETACLRYFNVYGDRMPSRVGGAYRLIIPIWAECTLEGRPLTITNDGNQRRDFIHVHDVVRANWLAMNNTNVIKGEAINIGSGSNTSINELAATWGGETQFIGTRLEPKETLANISKAKKLLDWEPTIDLKQWIKQYKKALEL
jgi:UDP-glucose 4-epimerase